jgi:hypothetical protein
VPDEARVEPREGDFHQPRKPRKLNILEIRLRYTQHVVVLHVDPTPGPE